MSQQFSTVEISVNSTTYTFQPYDRGANGAFVFRQAGQGVYLPRLLVSTSNNDDASDRMTIQSTEPRTCEPDDACVETKVLGNDLVKTELRFLAATSEADRKLQINKHIALLQELREIIETRGVIYS